MIAGPEPNPRSITLQRLLAGNAPLLLFACFLTLYGNAKSLALGPDPRGTIGGPLFGVLLLVLLALWARRRGYSAKELGIRWPAKYWPLRTIALVVIVGLSIAAAAWMWPEWFRDHSPDADRLLDERSAVLRALLLAVDTVIPEEFAFRGVLHAELERRVSPTSTVLIGGALFGAWHITITVIQMCQLALQIGLASVLGLAFAGAGLVLLRRWSRGLLPGAALHWVWDGMSLLMIGQINGQRPPLPFC